MPCRCPCAPRRPPDRHRGQHLPSKKWRDHPFSQKPSRAAEENPALSQQLSSRPVPPPSCPQPSVFPRRHRLALSHLPDPKKKGHGGKVRPPAHLYGLPRRPLCHTTDGGKRSPLHLTVPRRPLPAAALRHPRLSGAAATPHHPPTAPGRHCHGGRPQPHRQPPPRNVRVAAGEAPPPPSAPRAGGFPQDEPAPKGKPRRCLPAARLPARPGPSVAGRRRGEAPAAGC